MHKGAAAPSASNPKVPRELDDVVLRAVAPNPDSRIQAAAALAAELRSVAAILDVRGVPGEEGDVPTESTNVGKIVLIAVLILVALAIIFWLAA
jgi:serine/threonine protein kinase